MPGSCRWATYFQPSSLYFPTVLSDALTWYIAPPLLHRMILRTGCEEQEQEHSSKIFSGTPFSKRRRQLSCFYVCCCSLKCLRIELLAPGKLIKVLAGTLLCCWIIGTCCLFLTDKLLPVSECLLGFRLLVSGRKLSELRCSALTPIDLKESM